MRIRVENLFHNSQYVKQSCFSKILKNFNFLKLLFILITFRKGQFELNNQHYTLAVNNGPNHLHGGVSGFNSKIWNTAHSDSSQIKLQYESPDGEEGYPGTVHTDVTYDLLDHGSTVTFTMETKATTTHPTPIDLTNHSYFNLSGENEPTIYDHDICVLCDSYLPTDDDCLVTGVVASVSSTPYDLRTKANVGDRIKQLIELKKPAFDAYYCFSDNVNRKDNVVTVYSPKTGIRMQVASTQPGFQFYTAHFLTQIGKNGHCYGKHGGACFEFQGYPDAVNNKHFPNIILNPDEIYNHITNFSFDIV